MFILQTNDSSAKLARARFKKLGSVTADSSGIEADKDSSDKEEEEEGEDPVQHALEQRRKSIAAFLNGARHRLVTGESGEEEEEGEEEPSKSEEQESPDEHKGTKDLVDCFPRACYVR